MFKNVISEMGGTIQQWRCAIARPAPALRSVKVTPNHEEMLSSMRDESFKMWAFVGTIVMWLMLINFMTANSFSESRESSERNAEIRIHSTETLQITLTKSFLAVLKTLVESFSPSAMEQLGQRETGGGGLVVANECGRKVTLVLGENG